MIIQTALSDAKGQYLITGLPSATYIIHAHATNYQMNIATAEVEGGGITNINFSMLPNPGSVSGIVTSQSTGLPISGAIVDVIIDSYIILTTLTDSLGQYSLSGIFSADFQMHAKANSYQTQTVDVYLSSGIMNTVNFSLNGSPASITGFVTEMGSGDPIPSTIVEIHQNNQIIDFTYTDSLGKYNISGLPSGPTTVHAHNDSYQTGLKDVTLEENIEAMVDFSLAPDPSAVTGTIRDALTGFPISGAFVFVSLSDGDIIESTLTLSDGTYSIGGLFPETFVITAQKTMYITNYTPSFEITSGGEALTKNLSLYPTDAPHSNIIGEVLVNQFALQSDRIHRLSWDPSRSPKVVKYKIYRNGKSIGSVKANSRLLKFDDHNRNASVTDIYLVTGINTDGIETSGITVTLK